MIEQYADSKIVDAVADSVKPVDHSFHLTRSVVESIQLQRRLSPRASAKSIARYLYGVVGWTEVTDPRFVQMVFTELDKQTEKAEAAAKAAETAA